MSIYTYGDALTHTQQVLKRHFSAKHTHIYMYICIYICLLQVTPMGITLYGPKDVGSCLTKTTWHDFCTPKEI